MLIKCQMLIQFHSQKSNSILAVYVCPMDSDFATFVSRSIKNYKLELVWVRFHTVPSKPVNHVIISTYTKLQCKKGGFRCGHNQKKGGLRHVYNPKKGECRTDLVVDKTLQIAQKWTTIATVVQSR